MIPLNLKNYLAGATAIICAINGYIFAAIGYWFSTAIDRIRIARHSICSAPVKLGKPNGLKLSRRTAELGTGYQNQSSATGKCAIQVRNVNGLSIVFSAMCQINKWLALREVY